MYALPTIDLTAALCCIQIKQTTLIYKRIQIMSNCVIKAFTDVNESVIYLHKSKICKIISKLCEFISHVYVNSSCYSSLWKS